MPSTILKYYFVCVCVKIKNTAVSYRIVSKILALNLKVRLFLTFFYLLVFVNNK